MTDNPISDHAISDHEQELNDDQLARYARHVILDEVGEEGQLKLLQSHVAVVGAGGLGAMVLMYLAAAGVGKITVIDHDQVDVSNLQRQVIHGTDDVGFSKVESAKETIANLNPEVEVISKRERLTHHNALELLGDCDLVADGSDNFDTRYHVNHACVRLKKPLVSGALIRFEGQITTMRLDRGGACYRCLHPSAPDPSLVPRCDSVGVFGAVAGVVGALQATEILKELLDIGTGLSQKLLLIDMLDHRFRTVNYKRDKNCQTCGCQTCGDQTSD